MISSLRKGSNRIYISSPLLIPLLMIVENRMVSRDLSLAILIFLLGTPVISTLCSEPIRAMPTPPMLPDSDPGFFLFLSSFFLAEFGHTSRIFKTGPLVELIFKASNRYLNRDCLNRPPEIHSNAKGTPEFPPCAVINSRRFDPRVWLIIITSAEV